MTFTGSDFIQFYEDRQFPRKKEYWTGQWELQRNTGKYWEISGKYRGKYRELPGIASKYREILGNTDFVYKVKVNMKVYHFSFINFF